MNKKVEVIQEFLRPTKGKAVKVFVTVVNFYKRHIKQIMAMIASPLTVLTRKDKATGKTVIFENGVRIAKRHFRPPVLSYNPGFIKRVDCYHGFETMLEQRDA